MKDIKEIAKFTLSALQKAGADQASCLVSRGLAREITVDGGEINLMRSLFNNSVSMKVIKDGKKGVIAINKIDEEDITQAAASCVEAAQASVEDDAVSISPLTENADFETGVLEPDIDKLLTRLTEYIDNIGTEFPKIILEQIIAYHVSSELCLANTNGVVYTHKNGNYSLSSMFSAHEGDCSTSFNSYGFDFLKLDSPLLDHGIQREVYRRSERELHSVPFDKKFVGKVLLSPDCFGEFVSTALDNFLGDTTIIDGTSPWKNSLGCMVASEKLSISAIPLDENMIGTERIHTDGYISQNFDYIRNGKLVCFGLSEYAARKTGNERGLNSSSSIGIAQGDTNLEDMIKDIDLGIFVCRFSGGAPAVNGDFSGVAKNSFLIENGKITTALSETMISGNLADMFNNIVAISKETVCDGSSILPYATIDQITISGSC